MADQELMTLLNNIVSLVGQAKQAVGEEGAPEAPAEVNASADGEKDGMDMEAIKKFMKDLEGKKEDGEPDGDEAVKKSEESPSADDKSFAENSLDEQPKVNEENIKEVAKAIMSMMAKKTVKKSDPMTEMVKVMKSLAEETSENRKAIGHILEGLGVADEIKKSADVKKSEIERRPMAVSDLSEIKKSLEMIASSKTEKLVNVNDGAHTITKSLTDNGGALLHSIFTGRK